MSIRTRLCAVLGHSVGFMGVAGGLFCLPTSAGEPETPPPAKLTRLSLEELSAIKVDTVYGASKHAQKVSEAPAAVSIVTADDFKKFGYRTLADAMRSVPGYYVTSDRAYATLGVRGANWAGSYGGRTLVLVNGHRMSDPVYDSAAMGEDFPLDVDLIERVEVVRGPGFSLYGNNAFLSVINIVTRSGRDLNGVETTAAAASYDTYSGRVSYGKQFASGLEVLLSGTLFDSQGVDELPYPEFAEINNGVAEQCDGENAQKVFLSARYGDLSLTGLWGQRKKYVPTAQYETVFNDDRFWMADERAFVELKHVYEFGDEWLLNTRVYADAYAFDGEYPYYVDEDVSDATYMNVDQVKASWWGGEVSVGKTFFEHHRVIVGSEFNLDLNLRQENYDRDPLYSWVDVESDADNVGVYCQDEWSLRTNLMLNAAVRYDHFDTCGGNWNGRGGVIYSPLPTTTFKLIAGQGYRAPNAYELDYISIGSVNSPNLKPEQIQSYEFIWEQTLSRQLRLSTSLFYNELEDLIVQTGPVDSRYFHNAESADMRGVTVELSGKWDSGVRGRVAYTFSDGSESKEDGTDWQLRNSPRHLVQAGLSVPLWRDRVFASLETQAMSSRETLQETTTPGYLVLNGTLFTRELLPGLEGSLSVYNLLDCEFEDPAGGDLRQDAIEQNGRTFRVKLVYRF